MSYYSSMKRASITEAKNKLSALIDRVRHGETVVIEDRGVPVARLESVLARTDGAGEGRVARLERQGLVRRPTAKVPRSVLATAPPRPRRAARLSDAVLSERDESR
jgi:prevent-host-death family protein